MSTLSFVKKIASKTRYAGTEGERDAYNLIFREFQSLECEVTTEAAEYFKSDKYIVVYLLFLPWLFVGIILASWLVHPLTTLLFIVTFFAVAGILAKVFGSKLKQKIAKEKSINIVATMNTEAEHRLILCGHYDSARVYSKFAQKYFNILRDTSPFLDLAVYAYFTMLIVKGTYLFVAEKFDFASLWKLSPKMIGIWGVVWWSYLIVFATHTFLLTYSIIFSYRGEKFSYGADDNASGIAVMMETARRLQDKKLNLRVDFACFAAEEKGKFGSEKWVNTHAKELDRNKTYVFNLDCVGRGEKFFVDVGLGTIFKKHSDPMLCDIIGDVCSELELPLEECWGGSSDHAEFVKKKFRTCAVARANLAKAGVGRLILRRIFSIPLKKNIIPLMKWIHTENDTVDKIDEQNLEESVQLVGKFIEKLNQKVEQCK